jgi:hypothetical protein
MKTRYIYIDDIKEVDTARASVYDLNKRYIDNKGNMYGLKYNRDTRKVELIKILRTSSDRAESLSSNIMEKKIRERNNSLKKKFGTDSELENQLPPYEEIEEESEVEIGETTLKTNAEEAEQFNPDHFMQDLFKTVGLHKDRFSGVMNNIQMSKLITHEKSGSYNPV